MRRSSSRSGRTWRRALAVVCAAAVCLALAPAAASAASKGGSRTSTPSAGGWTYERATGPARTLVKDGSGRLLATFTDGSRTVPVTGPSRTFAESTTTATVTSTTWVRLLPAPFAGTVDPAWLSAALADTSPDRLAVAMRYTTGAPEDASYGPLVDGVRQEGSDWNDHLGVTAVYDGVEDRPEAHQLGAMDCSGYVRMVFGHLGGVPMVLDPDGVRLPRRAVQMSTAGPGTLVVGDRGTQVTDFSRMLPGDLVLFDASTDDGRDVDHVGVYLGKDSAGGHRFVSSRKAIDGPTMGDYKGASKLNGTGLYATAFRAVRRL